MNKGITIKVWHALVAVGTGLVIAGGYLLATKVFRVKVIQEEAPAAPAAAA